MAIRKQTKQMRALLIEYKGLRKEIFGDCMFVVLDNTNPKHKRYQQLFSWLFPMFRTKEWINPLNN